MQSIVPRILLADDEPQFRKAVGRLLEREGYEVVLAADASEAFEQLARQPFDLLIADVHMPGNEGLAVLRKQSAVPVLVVTGDPSVGTAVEALRGSAVDYLSKPLAPAQLLVRVAEGVERTRAKRRLHDAERRLRSQLELVSELRAIVGGGGVASKPEEAQAEPSLPSSITDALSPREREVLTAFRMTPNIGEVARTLHISPHTVKNHLKSIYRKLEVGSQVELLTRVAEAQRLESQS